MRTILKIAGFVGAILLSILVVAGLQSPLFIIESSRTIDAPPEVVFAQVGFISKWRNWSPWLEMEPDAEVAIPGPDSGPNAIQTWKGKKIGSGQITFLEWESPTRVRFQVEFKDWNAVNTGEINLVPMNGSTLVRWTMEGENKFMIRVFWMIFRVRSQLEKDFARGLELLEQQAKK